LLLGTGALQVQEVVDDEPVQPGAELALSAKGRQLGHELDENFLRRVLRILRVEHHPERDVVDPALVAADEQLQRVLAARLHELDEIQILVHPLGPSPRADFDASWPQFDWTRRAAAL